MGPVPQGAIEALVSVSMVTIYFKFVYYGDLWFWVTNDHMSTRVWDTFVLWNNLIGTGPIRLVPKGQVTRGCGDNSLGLVSLGHFIWTPKFAHMRHHYLVWDTWNRLYGNRIEILHTQHPLYLKNASVWVTLHIGSRNGSAVWVVKKTSSISDSQTVSCRILEEVYKALFIDEIAKSKFATLHTFIEIHCIIAAITIIAE